MIIADIPNITFPFSGLSDTIFRGTWVQVSILGVPANGYRVTLVGLIILTVLAYAVNGIAQALTGNRLKTTLGAVFVTILGAILVGTFVRLPFDFAIEGLRIIASHLGAIINAVFYVLFRGKASGGKS
jgi:hypothetical protein